MRSIKLVPIVALSAISFLPVSATAQQWIVRCDSGPKPLCLDATQAGRGGRVQVSECNEDLVAQRWDANKPEPNQIQNRWLAEEAQGEGCLDILVATNPTDNEVATNTCNPDLQAQRWNFQQDENGATISNQFTAQCLGGLAINQATVEPVVCPGPDWKFVNVGDDRLGCPPQ